jgi:uncharacterized spore protein YtfJ
MSELFRSIVEPLQTSASVKSVYGDPIGVHGKTLIPVARIGYGFGGGEDKHGDKHGGGGGMGAFPIGVFEVTATQTRFVPLNEKRNLVAAAMAGVLIGWVWGRRQSGSRA